MPPIPLKEVIMNTKTGYAAIALIASALCLPSLAVAEEPAAEHLEQNTRLSSTELAAEATRQAAAEAARAIVDQAEKELDLRLTALTSSDGKAASAKIATIAAN